MKKPDKLQGNQLFNCDSGSTSLVLKKIVSLNTKSSSYLK